MIMATVLAYRPITRRAGALMLWSVAGFGVFTVVFGLSRNVALSLAALALVGACDMVSVVVRQTMIQLGTPDEMRGRVSAVNMIFVGASNELGQFESGLTAQWFGTVPAVVLGGVGTLAVVIGWSRLLPRPAPRGRIDRRGAGAEAQRPGGGLAPARRRWESSPRRLGQLLSPIRPILKQSPAALCAVLFLFGPGFRFRGPSAEDTSCTRTRWRHFASSGRCPGWPIHPEVLLERRSQNVRFLDRRS